MAANNLQEIQNTGIKFYASKSKEEALALATQQDNPEPGAVCFVSDDTGNYIILDGKIFGDGAGALSLKLEDLSVTTDKTLDDYFGNNGEFITQYVNIVDSNGITRISITSNGIQVGNNIVATINQVETAEQNAKDYANSLVASVYKVKGSVQSYNNLLQITDPTVGDVYNVINNNMNYVYTNDGWDQLGSTIDLTNYATLLDVSEAVQGGLQDAKIYTELKISEYKAEVDNKNSKQDAFITEHSLQIANQSSIINQNTQNIAQNTQNITNIATQLTWQ